MGNITNLQNLTSLSQFDLLYAVDVSDTSVSASGSDKQITFGAAFDQYVPSSTELSQPGALQAYVDSELSKVRRHGPIRLPEGDITFDSTLDINSKTGVLLEGVGTHIHSTFNVDTWDLASVKNGTRLIYTGSGASPAISLRGCRNCKLSNFVLQHNNNGNGIEVRSVSTYHSDQIVFDNVSIFHCLIGLNAFISSSTDFLKMRLSGCKVKDCTNGVALDLQGSGQLLVDGLTTFDSCDTAISSTRPSHIYVNGASLYQTDTAVKAISSTVGATFVSLTNLDIERDQDANLPVLVDFSGVGTGRRVATVEGVVMPPGLEIADSAYVFKMNDDYVSNEDEINIGTILYSLFTDDFTRRVGIYDNVGTLTGYLDKDKNFVAI